MLWKRWNGSGPEHSYSLFWASLSLPNSHPGIGTMEGLQYLTLFVVVECIAVTIVCLRIRSLCPVLSGFSILALMCLLWCPLMFLTISGSSRTHAYLEKLKLSVAEDPSVPLWWPSPFSHLLTASHGHAQWEKAGQLTRRVCVTGNVNIQNAETVLELWEQSWSGKKYGFDMPLHNPLNIRTRYL